MNLFQKFCLQFFCSHIWKHVGEKEKLRTVRERDDLPFTNIPFYNTYTYYQQKQVCTKCKKTILKEFRELHI